MLITKFRLWRLWCTCTWNCPVHDIKRSGTYWLSMNFTSVFWSKNMCIREEFLKVGFVWPDKTYENLFLIGTYLQINQKAKQISVIYIHCFSRLNPKMFNKLKITLDDYPVNKDFEWKIDLFVLVVFVVNSENKTMLYCLVFNLLKYQYFFYMNVEKKSLVSSRCSLKMLLLFNIKSQRSVL